MKKLNQELRHKYAYNINDSEKGKIVSVGNGKDFMQLNRGFYDDIENNDLSIRQKLKQLHKIKNDSLKEFVFTNRKIPERWKKKLGYQTDVIKLLARDNNFLYYVGSGGGPNKSMIETASTKMSTNDSFFKTKMSVKNKTGLKTAYSQIFPKIKNKFISEDKTSIKNESAITNEQPPKILEEEENLSNNENTNTNTKIPNSPSRLSIKKKDIMSEREIVNLLEEFKLAYPLKLEKEVQEVQEDIMENLKKDDKNISLIDTSNLPKKDLFFSRIHKAGSSLMQKSRKYTPFVNIHQLREKRQKVFRQNIFNNLIPKNEKQLSNSMISLKANGKLRKIKEVNKKEEKSGPFLNFDNESFYKRIKINNPSIEKQLENINFWGPYYSYCPPCVNRNLEYYNNLEPNHCLRLIKYIKNIRGKKLINLKDNASFLSNEKNSASNLIFNNNLNENETIVEKTESEITKKY